MEDKCPKCGETLITRIIKKKIGLGSIDYPIAQTCPKCNWNKDLTGAGDIDAKPVLQDAGEAKIDEKKAQIISQIKPSTGLSSKPAGPPTSINSLIMIVLAILVVGAIAWVFFMDPTEEKQAGTDPVATPTPIITSTPVLTPPATTIVPEVTASGKQFSVKTEEKQAVTDPVATPTPIITSTPVLTPATTIVPEVTASGKQFSVKMETNRGITPKNATIKVGDEVIWTNEGTYAITLVSSDGLFEDKFLNNAKRTNYTFKKAGTFSFYLKDDKNMSGTVIVEP
jgi:plastocyanin